MHMQLWLHLVALDNRLAKISPLNSMSIDPKHTHTLYGVLSAKTKTIWYLWLDQHLVFVFLFLLFQVGALDQLFWSPPSPLPSSSSYHLALDHPLLSTHLAQGLVHRFHQLSKTKLGLSPLLLTQCVQVDKWRKNYPFHEYQCFSIKRNVLDMKHKG